MAFTAAQKTLTYELLDLFQGGTFDWFEYNDEVTGSITGVPFTNQIDFTKATTRLEAIFTAIEAASDNREVRIGEILTEYSDISLDSARITIGGGGGVSGARYDPTDHRDLLRNHLMKHLGIRVQTIRAVGIPRGLRNEGGGFGRSGSVSR